MSDLDLVGLRKIAEAAPSESEWVAEPIGAPDEGPTNHLIYEKRAPAGERVQYLVAWTDYDEAGWRFSEYIAAFDPPTVLRILDELEQQDAELAEYRNREAESRVEETQWGYLGRDGVVYHNATRRAAKQFKPREVPFLRREKRSYCTEWKEVVDDD